MRIPPRWRYTVYVSHCYFSPLTNKILPFQGLRSLSRKICRAQIFMLKISELDKIVTKVWNFYRYWLFTIICIIFVLSLVGLTHLKKLETVIKYIAGLCRVLFDCIIPKQGICYKLCSYYFIEIFLVIIPDILKNYHPK